MPLRETSGPAFEAWLEQRRALGQDKKDEIWEGVYHVAPHEHARNGRLAWRLGLMLQHRAAAAGLEPGGSFNLGEPRDFRVPDLGYHRSPESALYMPTAALVVEVLSPHDETLQKLGFYAAHGVEELWVLDPDAHTVRIWELREGRLEPVASSALMGISAADVEAALTWP
jgi:hypothetical protein